MDIRANMTEKNVDLDVKHPNKQNKHLLSVKFLERQKCMDESFRIIPEFRILRLNFHRKLASKC